MLPIFTTILPIASKILDKVIPNKAAKEAALMELQVKLAEQEGELIKALIQSDVAQAEINKTDSQSSTLFKSGWRPAISWICVIGLAYSVFMPAIVWVLTMMNYTVPPVPEIGGDILTSLTFGLLGLGGLRTYEKKTGVSK